MCCYQHHHYEHHAQDENFTKGIRDHMVWEKTSHSTCSAQPSLDPLIENTLQSIHIPSTIQTCMSSFLSNSSQLNCLPGGDGLSRFRPRTPELSPQVTGPEPGHHPHLPITHSLHPHSTIMSPPPLDSSPFRQFNQMDLVQLQTTHHPSHLRAPQRSTTWERSKDTPRHSPRKAGAPAPRGDPAVTSHFSPWGPVSNHQFKGVKIAEKNTIRQTNHKSTTAG